jgi:hypothetical protein
MMAAAAYILHVPEERREFLLEYDLTPTIAEPVPNLITADVPLLLYSPVSMIKRLPTSQTVGKELPRGQA